MKYKEDWEKAKENLEAFWNGEDIGRPLAAIFTPRKEGSFVFPELHNGPWTGSVNGITDNKAIQKWWIDPEENLKRMRFWFENTWFGGEAVPATYVNWGASAASAFFGSQPTFNNTSVWYSEVIHDWETWTWQFDEKNNKWWKQIKCIIQYLVDNSANEFFVGMPEFGNAADNLSLMRGMDKLALDCIDNPEKITEAINFMDKWWVSLHEELFQITKPVNDGGGVLPWMSLWAPGKIDQLACDFSSVISSRMFKKLFVHDIEEMGKWTEYGTYHLDGPACIASHLHTLLDISCIKAIEFTPGAGSPPTLSEAYIPKYQAILKSGKKLYLLAQPEEVQPLCEQLYSKGLFLCTFANSVNEGEKMLENMYKWSHK